MSARSPQVGSDATAQSRRGFSGPFSGGQGQAQSLRQRARLVVLRSVGHLYAKPGLSRAPRSLLLIRPDHLGDVLFLTPALHRLRRALPDTRITLLVGPWSREIVRDNPDLDAVITCPFPGFERLPKANPLAPYRLLSMKARELRDRGYEAAVVLRFDHWWGAWLTASAGIPLRVGYDTPETRPFLTHVLPYVSGQHEVQQNATLFGELVGGLTTQLDPTRYRIRSEDRAWAAGRLAAAGVGPGDRLVGIHPGAGAAVKQWPAAAWATVANALIEQHRVRIVLTGSSGERALTAAVAVQLVHPALEVAGQTTLGQLAALYERCAAVLGSDSGPLHLAVAVGVPTVHLYGPVSALEFGPWGDRADHIVLATTWPCAPCGRLEWPAEVLPEHGCVAAIQPSTVLQAAAALLVRG